MFYILKLEQLLWKTIWWLLKKLKIELPCAVLCCAKLLQSCLLLATLWTVACRLLCPWDSPDKGTGVGCHALLQGIFPTKGIKLASLKSPALAGWFFTTSTTWEAQNYQWATNPTPGHISKENDNSKRYKQAPLWSEQHYSQEPRHGSNLNVHQ